MANKPIYKNQSKSVVVSMWENNNSKLEIWNTVQVERIYKDQQGNWKSINTFRKEDLPDLIRCLKELDRELNIKIKIPLEQKQE